MNGREHLPFFCLYRSSDVRCANFRAKTPKCDKMSDFSKFPYRQNLHFARKSGVFVTKCQQMVVPLGGLKSGENFLKILEKIGKNSRRTIFLPDFHCFTDASKSILQQYCYGYFHGSIFVRLRSSITLCPYRSSLCSILTDCVAVFLQVAFHAYCATVF